MALPKWVARYSRRDREWRIIEPPRRLVATCPDEWAAQRLVTLQATAQAVLDVLIPTCEHVPFELLWAFARALGDERASAPDYPLAFTHASLGRTTGSSGDSVEEVMEEIGLERSRLIDQSKSSYATRYPDHAVIFNATIADALGRRLWWGDIDLTLDESALVYVAQRVGFDLYLYFEGDSRKGFVDNINRAHAVVRVSPVAGVVLGDRIALRRGPDGRIVRDSPTPRGGVGDPGEREPGFS